MLLYLLGILIPPLAILVYGKITQAALNAILWTYAILTPDIWGILFWIIASSHATYIIRTARLGGFRRHDY
ncbi:MAG: YqaE/Pmp3 family membrane protein [Emcibacter sp.]|nr:YqaE/Pmp3 family membrane protein [Emcibacter sp.]